LRGCSYAWKISTLEILIKFFRSSTQVLEKLFGYLQNLPVVLTHKFKALFEAKILVEMTLVKTQHNIGLI
jgi:hypothetical protein